MPDQLATTATDQPTSSRYIVGVDLGTTNSAVTFVDTQARAWRVETFAVPQVVASGQIEARESLPSFHYQPAGGEFSDDALRLPWSEKSVTSAVGVFARDHGALVPGRLIASAKSWLCHSGVDRRAELLPWRGAADATRLSPVDVSAEYLRHVRGAWDDRFPNEPLAEQDLVLTLPASFDEVARELTVAAAAQAGLQRVVLIEEPQAAFYAWLDAHADDWEQRVSPGDKILVCDIGGGTSDFTLIRVGRGGDGKVIFHRVAVGEHLILGGDNLDLALAHHLERKLAEDDRLEPRQWDVLVAACRRVKETLLGAEPPERMTVNLPGSGAKLIGGGLQVEVTRDEAQDVLIEGFFPRAALDEKPARAASGFREFGLPYAPDSAITHYLAGFLTAHRHAGDEEGEPSAEHDPARPDVVLFNGGLFAAPLLQQRLIEVLESWFRTSDDDSWSPSVLDNERPDLAVARGAAYYGMVRRGEGVRIAASLARSYYVGVESEEPAAVCLAPARAQPGEDIVINDRDFQLLVSQPVEFPLYVSSTRLTDRPGEVVAVDPEKLTQLPPIRTVFRGRKKDAAGRLTVRLHARLTEIGTLDMWCAEVGGPRSWKMQFDVRAATQTDVSGHEGAGEREGVVDDALWDACEQLIAATFGPNGTDKPDGIAKRLAKALEMDRSEWPPTLLRRMWDCLMRFEAGRRRSAAHEARWLNLLGYALRPGYGLAVDDWRVAETWRNVQGKLAHPAAASQTESWILWRRIAGGLSAGQQRQLAEPLIAPIRRLHRRTTTGKGGGGDFSFTPRESSELWRLLGSLELLTVAAKIELGNVAVDLMSRKKMKPVRPALIWALGRLGARVPVCGPLNTVAPSEAVANWLGAIMARSEPTAVESLAVMQIARRTDDRYRDIPDRLRSETLGWLAAQNAPEHFKQLVEEGGQLSEEEQGRVFGEALPKGLRISDL